MAGDVILGPDVLQPVLFELRLELLKIRVQVDPDVRGAVEIVLEAGQGDLAGQHAAADPVVAFGNEYLEAVLDQHAGADQRIMAAAGDDDVVVAH